MSKSMFLSAEKQLQKQPLQEKTALEQADSSSNLIRDLEEDQSEDIAGHMEQARRQKWGWIRLSKAESNRDRLADKLNKLMLALTGGIQDEFLRHNE